MNKLKIIAKSHMLSKTAPIFLIFSLSVSVLIFFGDFSLFVSYALDMTKLRETTSQAARSVILISASVIGIALSVLLSATLRLGRERWFMLNAEGKHPKFGELFYYFNPERYPRSLSAWCYAGVIKLGSAAVFFFPSLCLTLIIFYCVFYQQTAFILTVCLAVADTLLFIIGAVFMFVRNGEFLVYYPIIVSSVKVSPSQAYSYSRAMTSPVLTKLAVFRLSFAPWWFLCAFVVPSFYSWGYYKQSLSELAFRNEYLC